MLSVILLFFIHGPLTSATPGGNFVTTTEDIRAPLVLQHQEPRPEHTPWLDKTGDSTAAEDMEVDEDAYWNHVLQRKGPLPEYLPLRDKTEGTVAAANMIMAIAHWPKPSHHIVPHYQILFTKYRPSACNIDTYLQELKAESTLDTEAAKALEILEAFAQCPTARYTKRFGSIDSLFETTQLKLKALLCKFLLPYHVISSDCLYQCANAVKDPDEILAHVQYCEWHCGQPRVTVFEKKTQKLYSFTFKNSEDFGNHFLALLLLAQPHCIQDAQSTYNHDKTTNASNFSAIAFSAALTLIPPENCIPENLDSTQFLQSLRAKPAPHKTLKDLQAIIKHAHNHFVQGLFSHYYDPLIKHQLPKSLQITNQTLRF